MSNALFRRINLLENTLRAVLDAYDKSYKFGPYQRALELEIEAAKKVVDMSPIEEDT